jgi:hypothetical protein
MTTVRDLLADNPSGISRPGLLAWGRLRIDPAMTEQQLEDQLGLLGDEVIERQGFLYLRGAGQAAAESLDEGGWPGPPTVADQPATAVSGWVAPGGEHGGPAGSAPPDFSQSSPADGSTVPAGWLAPAGGPGRTVRTLIGVIAAIFGIGLFLLGLLGAVGEDGGTGGAGGGGTGSLVDPDALAVGDCFAVPPLGEFEEILLLDCGEPHGGEVFLVRDFDGDPGGFPTDAQFERWVEVNCDPAFDDYTGSAWVEQDLLDIGWFMPVEAGWAEGDRGMICWLGPADGSEATVSYRGSNP